MPQARPVSIPETCDLTLDIADVERREAGDVRELFYTASNRARRRRHLPANAIAAMDRRGGPRVERRAVIERLTQLGLASPGTAKSWRRAAQRLRLLGRFRRKAGVSSAVIEASPRAAPPAGRCQSA